MEKKFKFQSKEKFNQLPLNPGVYVFRKNKEFLYIGKAVNIKERVKNHFQQSGYKDFLFLNKVQKVGYIKTDSEIEALILEANLIKKYQPRYNVVWKDSKNYFFVGITKEDFPRVFLTHQTKREVGSRKYEERKKKSPKLQTSDFKLQTSYIGPFVDGKALKQTLKILRKVFPYRSCKTLPNRPCLWYHLGRCPAPCLFKAKSAEQIPMVIDRMKRECQKNAENVFKIFQGKKTQVLKDLKKEMKEVSKFQDFERAAKMRDQIESLEKILTNAKIFETQLPQADWQRIQEILKEILKSKKEISKIEAYDVSNIQGQEATGSMVTFINGLPAKDFYRKFKIKISGKPNDIAMLKETLNRRLNHPEWGMPDLILIDGGKAQLNAALQCSRCYLKQIKVIALAKKKNELFVENRDKSILLKDLPREIFNLILQLRDEAHRFAISYHKKLREKELFDI